MSVDSAACRRLPTPSPECWQHLSCEQLHGRTRFVGRHAATARPEEEAIAVSYTNLDVYKRQVLARSVGIPAMKKRSQILRLRFVIRRHAKPAHEWIYRREMGVSPQTGF